MEGRAPTAGRPTYGQRARPASSAWALTRLDLYQLHNPDPNVPLEESLGTLVALRDEGKVRHIGVSNVFGDVLERTIADFPIASVQNQYSLRVRAWERDIATCERNGIVFMP